MFTGTPKFAQFNGKKWFCISAEVFNNGGFANAILLAEVYEDGAIMRAGLDAPENIPEYAEWDDSEGEVENAAEYMADWFKYYKDREKEDCKEDAWEMVNGCI